MKIGYLTIAALAVALFAAQPVLAQSEAHEADPNATHTTTHKPHTSHKKKKKKSSSTAPATTAAPADTTKTQ